MMELARLSGSLIGIYSGDDVFHVARVLRLYARPEAVRRIQRQAMGVQLRAGIRVEVMARSTDAYRCRVLDVDAVQGWFWFLSADLILDKPEPATPTVVRDTGKRLLSLDDDIPAWAQLFPDEQPQRRKAV
jgi:hypothetical protein